MNEFWLSSLGPVTGVKDEAFTKSFEILPDGTTAIAKVLKAKFDEDFKGNKVIRVEWEVIKGEFSKSRITQNIKVHAEKESIRHTALNMLLLMFKLFQIPVDLNNGVSDNMLTHFVNKEAGIKVSEYYTPKNDGTMLHGNYVTEVHPVAGFVAAVGEYIKEPEFSAPKEDTSRPLSALERNHGLIDDDVIF